MTKLQNPFSHRGIQQNVTFNFEIGFSLLRGRFLKYTKESLGLLVLSGRR
jgi:hypothetical protein